MASCIKKARRFLSVIKALISRSLFVLHGLISIWRVTQVKRNSFYWALSGTLPLMLLETFYTLCKKKGGEWKWVCPSVVLYLATSVPAIWFLELDLMTHRLKQPQSNLSRSHVISLNGKKVRIVLASEEWCKILEQLLLLILIIGRWLLPKGEITREQLSQLLLVYIGMAADIIELFEAFKEQTVKENTFLTIVILSLWTASLSQFTLVITATKAKKTRLATMEETRSRNVCCPTEVISILISVFLQDAPFLVLRMLLIFQYDVLSYTNIFFTSRDDNVQNSSPATFPSQTSPDDLLEDEYDSTESSSEPPTSGGSSPVQRQKRRLNRKRRETMRQLTQDSSKSLSSSMDRIDFNHRLETECETSKTSARKRLRKVSLVTMATRRDSDSSSQRSPNRKKKSPLKTSTNLEEKSSEKTTRKENKKKDGKLGNTKKEKLCKGEVQKKIERFEKHSEPISDSDSDHVIMDKVITSREVKVKGPSQAKTPDLGNVSPRHNRTKQDKVIVTPQEERRDKHLKKAQKHPEKWQPVKDLHAAMAVMNESGKYRTVVVKSEDEGQVVYVISADDHSP